MNERGEFANDNCRWWYHANGRGRYTSLLLRILFLRLVPDTAARNGLNALIYLVIHARALQEVQSITRGLLQMDELRPSYVLMPFAPLAYTVDGFDGDVSDVAGR